MTDAPDRAAIARRVVPETAIVYRAAGRRWLTLRGAARAAAKQRIKRRWAKSGDEISDDLPRWARMVSKLAYIYRRAELKRMEATNAD